MTVDITPRRRQAFLPSVSATLDCVVTPDGTAPTTVHPVVDADGLFTLTSVTIKSSGTTSVACTP
jgi:hypothetical protein